MKRKFHAQIQQNKSKAKKQNQKENSRNVCEMMEKAQEQKNARRATQKMNKK